VPRRPAGHGVRIVDDISVDTAGRATLGRLAQYVRDTRIPLEMCPSSNVQTGAARSIAEHPIGLLRSLQFRVTVNTDNRLMSGVSVSSEMAALVEAFGYDWDDLRWLTINAMKSAFIPFDERLALINEVIKPGFAALSGVRRVPASSAPDGASTRRGSAERLMAAVPSCTSTATSASGRGAPARGGRRTAARRW
jgi:adenosine deaminase